LSKRLARAARNGIAAVITDVPGKLPHIDKAGRATRSVSW